MRLFLLIITSLIFHSLSAAANELVSSINFSDQNLVYADIKQYESEGWGPVAIEFDIKTQNFVIANPHRKKITLIPIYKNIFGFESLAEFQLPTKGVSRMKIKNDSIYFFDQANKNTLIKSNLYDFSTQNQIFANPSFVKKLLLGETNLENMFETQSIFNAFDLKVTGSPLSKSFKIQKAGISFEINSKFAIGSVQYIGTDELKNSYFLVEEVTSNPVIEVDQTVWRFNQDGVFLEKARVPLSQQIVPVEQSVTLSPNGEVYALVPREFSLDVIRLDFQSNLLEILNKQLEVLPHLNKNSTECKITREIVIKNAINIVNSSFKLSDANKNQTTCPRKTPSYINSEQNNYLGIPYNWGGFDGIIQFKTAMEKNYAAGNVNTKNGVKSCAKGLDCSGFVSRVWETTHKYGTSTISEISSQLSSINY